MDHAMLNWLVGVFFHKSHYDIVEFETSLWNGQRKASFCWPFLFKNITFI